jgi:hypothetical protein
MAWKRLKLSNTTHRPETSPRSANSGDASGEHPRGEARRDRNDELQQREQERQAHLALALARFREWDREMKDMYGPLYYQAMGFSVH